MKNAQDEQTVAPAGKPITLQPGFWDLDIGLLYESPTNPRKFYDEAALKKLTEDIRLRGILQPILVRAKHGALHTKPYEIIAGSRRYRAAMRVGLESVPCRIVEMSDQDAMEAQVVENLQREDVHPMDEAEGYHAMIAHHGYDTAAIAAKIGKSESYVLKRLKLNALIEPAKKAGWEGTLTVGHLLLLSRLQPKDQQAALTACLENEYNGMGIEGEVMSVKALDQFIQEAIILDLNGTRCAFDKTDTTLVPAAGPCAECPKRTGYNTALFDDLVKEDLCTDPACFGAKNAAHFARVKKAVETESKGKVVELSTESWLNPGEEKKRKSVILKRDWAAAKPGSCEHVKAGVVVHGYKGLGQTMSVCTNKNCSKHFNQYGAIESRADKVPPTPAEKAARKREARKEKIESTYRTLLFQRVSVKASPLWTEDLRMALLQLFHRTWHETRRELCKALGFEPEEGQHSKDYDGPVEKLIQKADRVGLDTLLVQLAVAGDLKGEQGTRERNLLEETAKRHGLVLDGLRKEAEELVDGKKGDATKGPACTKCGCTEDNACEGGCSWTTVDRKKGTGLCSACADQITTEPEKKPARGRKGKLAGAVIKVNRKVVEPRGRKKRPAAKRGRPAKTAKKQGRPRKAGRR